MNGKLYGIGVGPGEPDLLTIKAVNTIKNADLICIPTTSKETCRAYQIVEKEIPEIKDKKCICFDCKMTRDANELERIHNDAFLAIKKELLNGRTIAFLTIGDPVVYSTFTGIMETAKSEGFYAETINGITSFTAAASALGIPLSEEDEEIHILTGQSDIKKIPELPGTKIIMKAGKNISKIKEILLNEEKKDRIRVYAVANCGTEKECRYYGASEIPEDTGYMTTIIIKSIK